MKKWPDSVSCVYLLVLWRGASSHCEHLCATERQNRCQHHFLLCFVLFNFSVVWAWTFSCDSIAYADKIYLLMPYIFAVTLLVSLVLNIRRACSCIWGRGRERWKSTRIKSKLNRLSGWCRCLVALSGLIISTAPYLYSLWIFGWYDEMEEKPILKRIFVNRWMCCDCSLRFVWFWPAVIISHKSIGSH